MGFQAWRRYAHYYRGFRFRLFLVFLLALFQATVLVPVALIVRYAFDHVIPERDFSTLLGAGAAILALYLFSHALVLLTRYQTLKISKTAIQGFRDDLLLKVYQFSRSYHTQMDRQKLHNHLVQDTERVDVMTNAALTFLFPSALMSVALGLILAYLNFWLFLLLLGVLPCLFLVGRIIGNKLHRYVQSFHRHFEGFSKGMHFILSMMDLTRTVAAENQEIERQKQIHDSLREYSGKMAWMGTAYTSTQNIIVVAGGLLILIFGGYGVIEQKISIGDLLAFYFGFGLLREHLRIVYHSVPDIIAGTESLKHLFKILEIQELLPYSGKKSVALPGNLTLENISFSYGDNPVLREVSLSISPGETCALIGANGSGKSTLLNLILGFYRPNSGSLRIAGLSYDEIEMTSLRSQIGVVFQDPMLFPGSILENISYGLSDVSEAAIVEAAKLSGADAFIQHFPLGYKTPIGEGGALLSGGQGQRIALTRALLRRPALLILDEPTNHLDAVAVGRLRESLIKHFKDIAILLVSHDERMVELSDRIFLLEDGKIFGSQANDNVKAHPAYRRLFRISENQELELNYDSIP